MTASMIGVHRLDASGIPYVYNTHDNHNTPILERISEPISSSKPFITGNPLWGANLIENSIRRGFGALKGLINKGGGAHTQRKWW